MITSLLPLAAALAGRKSRKEKPRASGGLDRGAKRAWAGGQELSALDTKTRPPHHLFNQIAVMSSGTPPIRPNEKGGRAVPPVPLPSSLATRMIASLRLSQGPQRSAVAGLGGPP